MKVTVLGQEIECEDKVIYVKDEVAKEYIKAFKKGKGLAKKILKSDIL